MKIKIGATRFNILTPAIKLFTQMTFSMKAITISIVFVLPTLLLSGYLITDISTKLSLIKREQLGLESARALLPLIEITELQRQRAVEFGVTNAPILGWDTAQASYQDVQQHFKKNAKSSSETLSTQK
ncbi:hypothetical protein [Sapientia aquatica]|uniref:Methyl-accepting chemotaxis protein n=1 Tax=Sapientia aquatica TaxID=1549640 RepID=A0A4V3ATE5_9BURK|nr:hypothetical protein [Sapientia aquatica]TDK59646.1 hypothetical protein E2I14_18535 [Sapientia aquatica]